MDDMTKPHPDHLAGNPQHGAQLLGRAVETARTIIAVTKFGVMLCEHHPDTIYDILALLLLMQLQPIL